MLTGDKEETAVNIGHSCNLLLNDTYIHFLTKLTSPDMYAERLDQIYQEVLLKYDATKGFQHTNGQYTTMAMVMDGPSFEHFQVTNKQQRKQLLKIGQSCRSVIACRLTPIQKQLVTNHSIPLPLFILSLLLILPSLSLRTHPLNAPYSHTLFTASLLSSTRWLTSSKWTASPVPPACPSGTGPTTCP